MTEEDEAALEAAVVVGSAATEAAEEVAEEASVVTGEVEVVDEVDLVTVEDEEVVVDEELQVAEAHQEDEEPPEAVDEVVLEEEPRAVPTLSSSLIDTLVSSLPKERSISWSLETWHPASRFMERSESASSRPLQKTELLQAKSNTEYGILSDPSLLLVCSVDWTTFTSRLARRCSTLVLPAVPRFRTLPISSALKVSSTRSNSRTVRDVI